MPRFERYKRFTLNDFAITSHKDMGDAPNIVYDPVNVILENGVIRPAVDVSFKAEFIDPVVNVDNDYDLLVRLDTESGVYYVYRKSGGYELRYNDGTNGTNDGVIPFYDNEVDKTTSYSGKIDKIHDVVEYGNRLYMISDLGLFCVEPTPPYLSGETAPLICYKHGAIDQNSVDISYTRIQDSNLPASQNMGANISGGNGGFGSAYAFAYKFSDGTISRFYKYFVINDISSSPPEYIQWTLTRNKIPVNATHFLIFRYDFVAEQINDINDNLENLDYKLVFIIDVNNADETTLNDNGYIEYMALKYCDKIQTIADKMQRTNPTVLQDYYYGSGSMPSWMMAKTGATLELNALKEVGSAASTSIYQEDAALSSKMRIVSHLHPSGIDSPDALYLGYATDGVVGVMDETAHNMTAGQYNDASFTEPDSAKRFLVYGHFTNVDDVSLTATFNPDGVKIWTDGNDVIFDTLLYLQNNSIPLLLFVEFQDADNANQTSTAFLPLKVDTNYSANSGTVFQCSYINIYTADYTDYFPYIGYDRPIYTGGGGFAYDVSIATQHFRPVSDSVALYLAPIINSDINTTIQPRTLDKYEIVELESTYTTEPNAVYGDPIEYTITSTGETNRYKINSSVYYGSNYWAIPCETTETLIPLHSGIAQKEFNRVYATTGEACSVSITYSSSGGSSVTRNDYGYYSKLDIFPSARYEIEGGKSIAIINGRLFIGNVKFNNEWHQDVIAYSLPGEPGSFVDVFSVAYGSSGSIVRILAYKNMLAVAKQDGIFFVNVSDAPSAWNVVNSIKHIGVFDYHDIATLNDIIAIRYQDRFYLISPKGIYDISSRYDITNFKHFITNSVTGYLIIQTANNTYAILPFEPYNLFEIVYNGSAIFSSYRIITNNLVNEIPKSTANLAEVYSLTPRPASGDVKFKLKIIPDSDIKTVLRSVVLIGDYQDVSVDGGAYTTDHEYRTRKRLSDYNSLYIQYDVRQCKHIFKAIAYIRPVDMKKES